MLHSPGPGMEAARALEAASDSDAMYVSNSGLCGIKDWNGSSATDSDDSCSPDGDVDGADDAACNSDGNAVVRSEITAVFVHVPQEQEQIQS